MSVRFCLIWYHLITVDVNTFCTEIAFGKLFLETIVSVKHPNNNVLHLRRLSVNFENRLVSNTQKPIRVTIRYTMN